MSCPDMETLSLFAAGEADEETFSILEDHLDACEECRTNIEKLLSNAPESKALEGIEGWEDEQESLRPTLTALLASSFRVSEKLNPASFSFISGGSDEQPEGRLGDLVITGLLGSGAMGAVFRAHDEKLEREVAVKALRPEYGESREIRQLFLDEARAMAAVDHESVLPIHDVSREEAAEPYFVMPLIEGGRLRDRIDRDGKLDPDFAIQIAAKTARALEAVHESGGLHRDIKPTNVLLEDLDAPDRVWLADFGLARVDSHGFGEGSLVGTKGYVAPEIEDGKGGSIASDLYSFGAMLFEMLEGKCPGHGSATLDSGAHPEWLHSLIRELLSSSPGARPGSAAEVAKRLEEGLRAQRAHIDSRRRRERLSGQIVRAGLFALAAAVLFLLWDASTGWVRSGAVLRIVLDRPVSVDGRLVPFATLGEAMDSSSGDMVLRLGGDEPHFLDGSIPVGKRSLRMVGKGIEKTRISARVAGRTGIAEIAGGRLELESLSVRFRASGRVRSNALFYVDEGNLHIKNCSIRHTNALTSVSRGLRIFSLRGNSALSIEDSAVVGDNSTVGILVVSNPGETQKIFTERLRFVGQHFVVAGSEALDSSGPAGTVDVKVTRSLLLTASPVRYGRGQDFLRVNMVSEESIWQGSGPFLLGYLGERNSLAEVFSFSESTSLFSAGGALAVELNAGSNTPARTVINESYPEQLSVDWNRFRELAPDRIAEIGWRDWILTYRPGSPPLWNEDIEWEKRGDIREAFGLGIDP